MLFRAQECPGIHVRHMRVSAASLREGAVESCFDGVDQGCVEPTERGDEPSSLLGEPQAGSRSGAAVFEKGKPGRLVQFAEQAPCVPIGHTHAERGAAQRSELVNGLEQPRLAVAEQRARAESQPELRFDAKASGTWDRTTHRVILSDSPLSCVKECHYSRIVSPKPSVRNRDGATLRARHPSRKPISGSSMPSVVN